MAIGPKGATRMRSLVANLNLVGIGAALIVASELGITFIFNLEPARDPSRFTIMGVAAGGILLISGVITFLFRKELRTLRYWDQQPGVPSRFPADDAARNLCRPWAREMVRDAEADYQKALEEKAGATVALEILREHRCFSTEEKHLRELSEKRSAQNAACKHFAEAEKILKDRRERFFAPWPRGANIPADGEYRSAGNPQDVPAMPVFESSLRQ